MGGLPRACQPRPGWGRLGWSRGLRQVPYWPLPPLGSLPGGAGGRWSLRCRRTGAICRGGVHLASVYLHTSVGASAPCNLDLLEAAAAVLRSLQGPWILGGDFNATPAELAATGFLRLAGNAVIKAPGDATAGTREIDYFVVSPGLAHAAAAAHVLSHTFGPHHPVRLYVRASPRAVLVRKVVAPRGFPAVLPMGPRSARPCGWTRLPLARTPPRSLRCRLSLVAVLLRPCWPRSRAG